MIKNTGYDVLELGRKRGFIKVRWCQKGVRPIIYLSSLRLKATKEIYNISLFVGKLLSKKLNVEVDFGDAPEHIGRQISDNLSIHALHHYLLHLPGP